MATTARTDSATREEYLQLHRWMCMAKAPQGVTKGTCFLAIDYCMPKKR